jgi:hypothetical protein
MPLRHGKHGAISFFIGLAASVLFSELLRRHAPSILAFVDGLSASALRLFRVDLNPKTVSFLIIMLIVIVLYWIAYGVVEKRGD